MLIDQYHHSVSFQALIFHNKSNIVLLQSCLNREEKQMGSSMLNFVVSERWKSLEEHQNELKNVNSLRIFSYASIMVATKNLSV